LKCFGGAFALATRAFVLTMLKDLPKSEASDPAVATVTTVYIHVPDGTAAVGPQGNRREVKEQVRIIAEAYRALCSAHQQSSGPRPPFCAVQRLITS
jgi:hypothetical protein